MHTLHVNARANMLKMKAYARKYVQATKTAAVSLVHVLQVSAQLNNLSFY